MTALAPKLMTPRLFHLPPSTFWFLTTVDVPAGQEAVEHFLAQTKQQLASHEDEVQRCHLRLRRSVEALSRVLGSETAREARARWVARRCMVGAPARTTGRGGPGDG